MEEDLDEISRGERESIEFLKQFYFGTRSIVGCCRPREGRREGRLSAAGLWRRPRERRDRARPHRRFGPFVQVGEGGPVGRHRCRGRAPADLSVDKAMELVRAKAEGPRTLGVDPATGQNVYVMNGRYGAYVQLGKHRNRRRRRARHVARSRSARRCRPA
jgi:DNA topoisomerase-1